MDRFNSPVRLGTLAFASLMIGLAPALTARPPRRFAMAGPRSFSICSISLTPLISNFTIPTIDALRHRLPLFHDPELLLPCLPSLSYREHQLLHVRHTLGP